MFNLISDENFKSISLPRESCLVNYSAFREFSTDILFRSFSVKYVVEGCESYKIDGNRFNIKKEEYLLGNNFSGGSLQIASHNPVMGICIDIAPRILSEVVAGFTYPSIVNYEPDLENFFTSECFPENKYSAQFGRLGANLSSVKQHILKADEATFDTDFFYQIAESIVTDQLHHCKQLRNIKTVKLKTKKELFRKVQFACQYIDNHYTQIRSISEVAAICNMSEYHFFRLFRQVYSISPHQYIRSKQLQYATILLDSKEMSISDVAFHSGFIDLHSFSKSFKKQFGYSPQNYQRRHF